jgi:hypothetical protein
MGKKKAEKGDTVMATSTFFKEELLKMLKVGESLLLNTSCCIVYNFR